MDDPMKISFSEISTPTEGVIAVGVTDDRTLGATGRALDEQSGGKRSTDHAAALFVERLPPAASRASGGRPRRSSRPTVLRSMP